MPAKRTVPVFQAIVLALLLLPVVAIAHAQDDEPALRLSLRRDFGSAFGNDIQGTFSMRVEAPAELTRVVFYIDDERIGEDVEAPYALQFNTGSYGTGVHRLHAVGTTPGGTELRTNTLTREFISGGQAGRTAMWIVIPIIILAVGGRLLTSYLANRGRKGSASRAIHGPVGGTICPKCHRPFAMHMWAPNVVAGKLDRCPHCGKWSLVRRAHPDVLDAAYEAMVQAEAADAEEGKAQPAVSEEEALRRRLDDSRYSN